MAQHVLNLALNEGELSDLCPSRFIPGTRALSTNYTPLGGHQNGFGCVQKRQISYPCQESVHDSSVVHLCIELAFNEWKIRQ